MRVLYLDCFSGISGDMTVGALCDLGVKPSALEWELSKVEIGDFHMHFERQNRQNIEGVKFGIHEGATHTHEQDEAEEDEQGHEHDCECGHQAHSHGGHGHGHQHEHQHEHQHAHGRSHAEIRRLIEQSTLSPFVKKHALGMFQRIAVAEGKIHGRAPDEVEFHEVGALDSIADVICVCAGIEALGVEKVFVSPLFDGRGWIETAHGRFPVPAPATLEILTGIPLTQIDEPFEFVTPTGAAIVAEFGSSFGPMPALTIETIGYGIGSRVSKNRPNVLRAILGEISEAQTAADYETDTITRLETNLDDLSPELTGPVIDKLLAAGALDAFLTPIQMKKSRPATQLTVLCEAAAVAKLADIIFRETTSFGLRLDAVDRLKLAREFHEVATPFGAITVKIGRKAGEVLQVAPEFESCRAASEKTGAPLRRVYDAAREAWSAAEKLA